uniref:Tetratricopeptide (TPR) repeat n=1 Tax=Candidatus Kentrum sp. LFY TaxID=2126342 RepID=A0A450X0J5_9GAMM|nr:MAG: Tetratricopeptide (TPR) repeat [Candidatus Kentron sp. LFY]
MNTSMNTSDSATLSRIPSVDSPAGIMLQVGARRAAAHAEEFHTVLRELGQAPVEQYARRMGHIPGAEALAVLGTLPLDLRNQAIRRLPLDEGKSRLVSLASRIGQANEAQSAAAALATMFPDALTAHDDGDAPRGVNPARRSRNQKGPEEFLGHFVQNSGAKRPKHNLPARQGIGFFGRRQELHDIERWFAGSTRRISLTGFGGQGKTALALEAGRRLLGAGLFERAVFVDYAQIQAADARAVAVGAIGSVLEESLIDAAAATEALRQTSTLVILDNLEAVSQAALGELLTAAADWSRAGGSRVLLTSRVPDFGHPDYRVKGAVKHRRIALQGLDSAGALDWFAALFKLPPPDDSSPSVPPPKREELIALFDQVEFHPLSIAVLTQQLKTRSAPELGARLEKILRQESVLAIAGQGAPPGLIATLELSLELSLEGFSEAERHAARRLGVFQGGAMEDNLLAITGLAITEGEPAAEDRWPGLRRQLEAAALLQIESIPGVAPPFLRFHPTLAPLLWAGITAEEQGALTLAHRRRYYQLAGILYHEDDKHPHEARAIVRRELPNLLHACRNALDAGDADAVAFVTAVNLFLNNFGMGRDLALLTERAEAAGGERGSRAWRLAQSNRGQQRLAAGRASEAAEIFADILAALGDEPSFNRAKTLVDLGRCHRAAGRPDQAEVIYRQGIAVTEQLEPSDNVKRKRALLRTDLADVLADQGKYAEARAQYGLGLETDKELNDLRGQGVTLGQLGTLALEEGDLPDAVGRYREALALFQRLGEPAMEAIARHQLGRAFQEARQWGPAEQHYREAARLEEQRGDLAAAQTWNQLAIVNEFAGRPEAAERWVRKAIGGGRQTGDTANVSKMLNNLAALLQSQPGRLAEARALAEEALAIKKELEPGAAEIWTTYGILAQIADRQSRPDEAIGYRRLARDAKRGFAGTAHEMKQFAELIAAVVAVCAGQEKHKELVAAYLEAMGKAGGEGCACADAIGKVLAGERDEEMLCAPLGFGTSMIIETILRAIADPETLSALLPPPETA